MIPFMKSSFPTIVFFIKISEIFIFSGANRQVAILCNHQRAIPKSHEKSMENLENKVMNGIIFEFIQQ